MIRIGPGVPGRRRVPWWASALGELLQASTLAVLLFVAVVG